MDERSESLMERSGISHMGAADVALRSLRSEQTTEREWKHRYHFGDRSPWRAKRVVTERSAVTPWAMVVEMIPMFPFTSFARNAAIFRTSIPRDRDSRTMANRSEA